jgi:hypothetical protein
VPDDRLNLSRTDVQHDTRRTTSFSNGDVDWFKGRWRAPSPNPATVCNHHNFLAGLDADEKRLYAALEKDRQLALRLLTGLPGRRLGDLGTY